MNAIEVDALFKRYPAGFRAKSVEALAGVSLHARQGSALGLVGPNGAGKTTLLKILLGLVHKTAGTVRVLGGDPAELAVRRRIGYLPERLHLPAALTARELMQSIARLKETTHAGAEVERQLKRVGMWAHRDGRLGRFSKGMKQRVALAAALLGEPDLLVLDEPTDGVDPQGRAEVREILLAERARGATIFLNSHLLSESERICDDVCILVGGRIVRAGPLLALRGEESGWTVRFQGEPSADTLRPLGFTPGAAGSYTFEGSDVSLLNERLQHARARGALLTELRPALRTLEDVMLQALRGPHE